MRRGEWSQETSQSDYVWAPFPDCSSAHSPEAAYDSDEESVDLVKVAIQNDSEII